ncbi:MAG: TAT-variant-translocated molybdopterin oxidoreductase, partial [Acidobacteriota bacterium]
MKNLDSTTHAVTSKTTPAPEASGLDGARRALSASPETNYFRSLEELAEKPEFEELLQREFPRQAAEWGSVDRRRFLQLSGASLGLAGLTACTKQPPEKIIPYVRAPEDVIPGRPLFFASAIADQGFAAPVLAESHMGRPTKVEGNPEHPASLAGADSITQATTYDLYDPDRSQAIRHLGQVRTWETFVQQVEGIRSAMLPIKGDGLAIVTGRVTSPTLTRLLDELREQMPKMGLYVHEPGAGYAGAGFEMATGERGTVRYDFSKADVVLSVDSDFLNSGPSSVRYSKDFSRRRKALDLETARTMSRYYAVESMPMASGTSSDHRLAVKPTEVSRFVLTLAGQLGVAGVEKTTPADERTLAWIEEVAADLQDNAGRSAIIVGDHQPAEVHALALAINEKLGNLGSTVFTTEPVEMEAPGLEELLAAINADKITTLVVLGTNPVYTSLADQDVIAAIDSVPLRLHLGTFIDETGERCHWHVPESHSLESWGDLRSFDGTATILQPIITPLYDSHTMLEVVAAFAGYGAALGRDLVQETWSSLGEGRAFNKIWRRTVHNGFVEDSAAPVKDVTINVQAAASSLARAETGELEIIFRPDPTVVDGRFANNGWLQECPKPLTKLTWDNALLMSPRTAEEQGLGNLIPGNESRDTAPLVTLTVGDHQTVVPVWPVPGMSDGTLVLHLGYGRTKVGSVGNGAGFDANAVRAVAAPWQVEDGVKIEKTGEKYPIACTQDHHSMEGRALIVSTNVPTWEAHPESPLDIHLHVDPMKSMLDGKDFPYDSYRWGLSIDLSSCSGCNACLIACVAENNIPVVGKDQVRKGREMHWVRIDRYYQGNDPNNVEHIINQPVPCMQCEQAPCEVVCPVAATVHSDEGLNDMVYNRCVGTRYCSNNCPYKVRRFNFLLYQDFETPQLQLGRNPDVTVRSRGVMEKCTYCVQRINQARIEAHSNGRRITEKDLQAACSQSCPSDSIVFGDLNDKDSELVKVKSSKLDYGLLEELGTRPRTTYLARLSNPNPKLWARVHPDRPLVKDLGHHGGGHGHGGHGGHSKGHGGHGGHSKGHGGHTGNAD